MIAPGPREIVIKKQKPSGFFGTNLASYLTLLGCDSVIVVGTTTSGCVRATAVDAFSLNYRVTLAEEGCFDRSEASHAVSLWAWLPRRRRSKRSRASPNWQARGRKTMRARRASPASRRSWKR
jgi:nicotinamidase-related amidase